MNRRNSASSREYPRSLPVDEWPEADRRNWEATCRPSSRLSPGGAAGHFAKITREQLTKAYGAFLGFLQRNGRLDHSATTASQVTPSNVDAYVADLTGRVRSVTVYIQISKLRTVAQLLAPLSDHSWLIEIERDLAFVMVAKPKFDRLVLSSRLLEAGLTLMMEARRFASGQRRARGVRNGLMIALLALCPVRLKNFASLEIGHTFKQIHGAWWIALPSATTKSRRPDERRIPDLLKPYINIYLHESRPALLRAKCMTNALWISSTTGGPMTQTNLGHLISKVTLQTVGVAVSPHLFRAAAASTAAAHGGKTPHLASALLNHTDPRVTEAHYNRASSMSASKVYALITESFLGD